MANSKVLVVTLALLLLAVVALQATADEAPPAPPLDVDQPTTENQTIANPEIQQTQITVAMKWVKYINPTDKNDTAFGTCIVGDYVAVVGDAVPYVSLLDRLSGNLVKSWKGTGGSFYNCLTIEGKLYVVGSVRISNTWYPIYVFDNNLNLLRQILVNRTIFYSITYDDEYIYVGGSSVDSSKKKWTGLIEKRTKQLDLVRSTQVDAQDWRASSIWDIAVNPSTGEIWALGVWEDNYYNQYYFLVIYNKRLEEVNWIEYQDLGALLGITFDDAGNAYVVGSRGVAKFDKYGNLIAVNKADFSNSRLRKIIHINGYIYVFGHEYIDGFYRQVVYILDNELNLLTTQVLSKDLNEDSWFNYGRPSSDGRDIYVTGVTSAFGDARWVVYAIRPQSGGLFYLVVRGLDGRVWWRQCSGVSCGVWSSVQEGFTDEAPGAVAVGGRLWLVVRGLNNGLYFGYVDLATGRFSGWQPISGGTYFRPALATDGSRLWLVVTGFDGRVWVNRYDIATGQWGTWQPVPYGSTNAAPAAAYYAGQLYIAVRGTNGVVYYATTSDGASFSSWYPVAGSTPSAPYLTSDGTRLYLVVRGDDNRIWVSQYSGSWSSWEAIPGGYADETPAAVAVGGRLYVAVKGFNNVAIWITYKDTQWSTWTPLDGGTNKPITLAPT